MTKRYIIFGADGSIIESTTRHIKPPGGGYALSRITGWWYESGDSGLPIHESLVPPKFHLKALLLT